jgi:hypothetical protein
VSVVDQWEYKIETFSSLGVEKMKNRCNELGADGWELVSTSAARLTGADYMCMFKRRGLGQFVPSTNDDAGWGG